MRSDITKHIYETKATNYQFKKRTHRTIEIKLKDYHVDSVIPKLKTRTYIPLW